MPYTGAALEKYPSLVTGYKPDKNPPPAPAKVDVKQFFFDEPEVIDLVSPTNKKIDVTQFFSDEEEPPKSKTKQSKSKTKTMSLGEIIQLINEIPDGTLKPASKKTYINKLNAIKKYAKCDEADFVECFNDAEKTVPLILKEPFKIPYFFRVLARTLSPFFSLVSARVL
jgi:hypothetical protein